ncbi:alpha/beta hydrolase [Cellulophaga sp. F20128]|uniref:alpha/beta hydrolase n=1 Tax=Cellulophaga sp. F20128 TaxID=2926413 RepID=UPI001FF38DED|nr:alpha/beta hydrolase [Cellulophaga sp. F20128]MCK0158511.1 alpha/beta hydrolase [Cellulophaga sp. F20128]
MKFRQLRKTLLLFIGMATLQVSAQEFILKKGVVVDAIKVADSLPGSFSLFIPSNFEMDKKWPICFVFDFDGREKQVMRLLATSAEENGFILAASNNLKDTLSLSKNVMEFGKVYNTIVSMLPINFNQIYSVGFDEGGKLATTMPSFIRDIAGVLSYGSYIDNLDILNLKKPYQYIGVVRKGDFDYIGMSYNETGLNKLKFPNELLVFEENQEWPPKEVLNDAFQIFTLSAMAKGNRARDENYINANFEKNKERIQLFVGSSELLKAEKLLAQTIEIYRPFKDIKPLKEDQKRIKKDKIYKSLKRAESNTLFKEQLLKDDYYYYMNEDIFTHNFNNLGWWKFQTEEIEKYKSSPNAEFQFMGQRLEGYLKALVEDNLDLVFSNENLDNDAISFLWMLKTVVSPKDYDVYLKLISHSAKFNDFGTSVFYLEELLKNGYTDADKLYDLEFTTLLKISPEYNEIIEKYLKKGRYLLRD